MATTDKDEWILLDKDLTTRLGFLPVISSNLYLELGEPGSGELTLPLDTNIAPQITSGMFCQCYYRGSARGGFFVDNINPTDSDGGEYGGRLLKVNGRGALALLEDAMVWTEDTSTATTRSSIQTTLADFFIDLLTEAQTRGALDNLTWDFTASVDSDGVSWTDDDVYTFNIGTSLLDVARTFATAGIGEIEITFAAGTFTLSIYKNGVGSNKASTLFMRIGTNCEDVTTDERGNDIRNALLVKYQAGFTSAEDSTSIASLRRREKLLNVEAAQSASSALTYANVTLDSSKDPLQSINLKVYDGVGPFLFNDYILGDWVSVDRLGTVTSYRILGVQASFSAADFSHVTLELNSIIRENENNLTRQVEELTNLWNTARDTDLLETQTYLAIGGPNGTVLDLQFYDGYLYVGGAITAVDGRLNPASKVVKMEVATGVWSNVGDTSSMTTGAYRIQVVSHNEIYAMVRYPAECWKWNGSTWTKIGYSAGTFHDIYYWVNAPYTGLYLTGVYTEIGGDAGLAGTVRWNGSAWVLVSDGMNGRYSLCPDGDTLIVGGYESFSSTLYGQVSVIRPNLTYFYGLSIDTSREYVRAVHCPSTNNLYFVDELGEVFRATISDPSGATPSSIGQLAGGYDKTWVRIFSYLLDVYVTGYFSTVDGIEVSGIAKYVGGSWYPLNGGGAYDPSAPTKGTVATMVWKEDTSTMYIGGNFEVIGGQAFQNLTVFITSFEELLDNLASGYGGQSHNSLSGIQGGASNDYYHFTGTQHTDLTDGGQTTLHTHTASNIPITDSGGYFTGTDVEAALQELGAGGGGGGSVIKIDQSGGTSDTYGVLSGTINGSNTTFTVSNGSYISGSLTVYLNGQLQTQGTAEDWDETTPASGTFDFNTAPISGDEITVIYVYSNPSGDADTLDGQHGSYYLDADNIVVDDTGGYFTGTDVEGVLQEIGAKTLAYGTYTPTLTNGTNIAASVLNQDFIYMRVGSVVHVCGSVQVDVTTAGVLSDLSISIPIASNFGTSYDLNGNATTPGDYGASIIGDSVNDIAVMYLKPASAANLYWRIVFSYRII